MDSRSRLRGLLVGVTLALAMVACQGGGDGAGGASTTSDESASTTAATEPDTTEASEFGGEPPIELAGTTWGVTHYSSEITGGVTNIWPDTGITLDFGSDGTISGNGGCNDYSGTYAVTGGYITDPDPFSDEEKGQAIEIEVVVVTAVACDSENLMEQEGEYLEVLERVEIWSIGKGFGSEESLLLRSLEDGLLVEAGPAG